MATQVIQLEPEVHEVKEFDCGNPTLNEFLQSTAGQHQRKLVSKTYVLVDDEVPTEILGFYTVALRRMIPKEVLPPQMAKRLPREVPGFTLARLAIRNDLKKQGHGEYMLIHAIDRVARVADEVGGVAMFVDAKSEDGAAFYKKYGFVPFPDNPLILCLPFADLPK
jgi:GNAT superfamily N-acetyltransferase